MCFMVVSDHLVERGASDVFMCSSSSPSRSRPCDRGVEFWGSLFLFIMFADSWSCSRIVLGARGLVLRIRRGAIAFVKCRGGWYLLSRGCACICKMEELAGRIRPSRSIRGNSGL